MNRSVSLEYKISFLVIEADSVMSWFGWNLMVRRKFQLYVWYNTGLSGWAPESHSLPLSSYITSGKPLFFHFLICNDAVILPTW